MKKTPERTPKDITELEASKLKAIYTQRKQEAKQNGEKLSQEHVAERCGWSGQSAVSQYMNGRMPLNLDALLKLSKALRFSPREVSPRLASDIPTLYLAEEKPDSDYNNKSNAVLLKYTRSQLPVIGQASAGRLQEIMDNQECTEWVAAPGPTGPQAFALRIEGISMEPRFMDGEKVIIDPDLDWSIGDFVFARQISTNTGTFKQIKREGDELYLSALNEQFQPRYTRLNEDWVVVGKARWKLTDL